MCLYADAVRRIRQKEYDNAALYSETDAEQAEQLERSHANFIEYFDHIQKTRHRNSSDSIIVNWRRVYELLKIFAKGDILLFSQIDMPSDNFSLLQRLFTLHPFSAKEKAD